MVVEGGAGNPERLKEVCTHTHHCVGFNTNGILKQSLLPPYKWMRWTNHPQHGLYVRGEYFLTLCASILVVYIVSPLSVRVKMYIIKMTMC